MTHRYFLILPMLFGILFLGSGCSKSDSDGFRNSDAEAFENDICLAFEHSGLSEEHKTIIEGKIAAGITAINRLLPINQLHIRIVENVTYIIPEIGIGGYNPNQNEVLIAIDSNFNDLDSSLEVELIPLLAHEIHHAKRRRSVGYGNTLLQAVISEGLADHFSIEVSAIDPPLWAVALTDSELQEWIDTASGTWNSPSYDHNAWFFGSDQNIPRWAGYSIGYELVKNYISENPGKRASDLHDEPANSFLP